MLAAHIDIFGFECLVAGFVGFHFRVGFSKASVELGGTVARGCHDYAVVQFHL